MSKILPILFGVLLVLATGYKNINGVLELNAKDLKELPSISPRIFVKYYVPWCRHCQKLEHVWLQLAEKIQQNNLNISIAQIDCEEYHQTFDFEQIDHYPMLVYYEDGKKAHCDGQRTLNYLYKWLRNRVSSSVITITEDQLIDLHGLESQGARIVYFGKLEGEHGRIFQQTASFDNYNDYYHVETENEQKVGSVRLMRPYAEEVTISRIDEDFFKWVRQHDQPSVVAWDQRAIYHIFRDGHTGIFYFAMDEHYFQVNEFILASQEWNSHPQTNKNITFTIVNEIHEDYFGFLEYLKVNPKDSPVVIIEGGNLKKFVHNKKITDISIKSIKKFITDYFAGEVQGQELQDQSSHHHDHDHQHDHDHNHDHDHDHDSHQHQHQNNHQHTHEHPAEEKDLSAGEEVRQHYTHQHFQRLVYDKTVVPDIDREPDEEVQQPIPSAGEASEREWPQPVEDL